MSQATAPLAVASCRHLIVLLGLTVGWAGCSQSRSLPAARVPSDTLLMREVIALGADRTVGRRDRFDRAGCWTQAPNTWLWVHDPVLQAAQDPWLYLNGDWDLDPWFCLSDTDLWRLTQAVQTLPPTQSPGVVSVPAWEGAAIELRYTAIVDGSQRSAVAPLGAELRTPMTAQVATLLASLAAEGAWAGSPESVTARAARQGGGN